MPGEQEEREDVIVLTDEEGKEHEFTIVDVIEVGEREYAVLLPPEEEGDEAVILRIDKDGDGEDIFVDIEDDDEYDRVAEAWDRLLDEEDEAWEAEEDEDEEGGEGEKEEKEEDEE